MPEQVEIMWLKSRIIESSCPSMEGIERSSSVPYAKGSATSKKAAERIKGHAAKQRSIILGYIAANGPVTDQEISAALGIPGDSVRPRRGELAKDGLIKKLDEEGRTKAGRHATRWAT